MAAGSQPLAVRAQRTAMVVFAVYHLGLGLWMAVSPGTFFDVIGPFGERNDHYTRDTATFYLAFAAAFAGAISRPSWRAPVLALVTVQYALHTVNHLVDIGDADPKAVGVFDFVSLLATTALLAGLLAAALREHDAAPSRAGQRGSP